VETTMNLVIQQGPEAGRQLSLERGLLIIGRGQDCDLVLADTQASRHHAEVRRFGDQWLVVDLGSTNGTYLGDVRLPANEARNLPLGMPVTIGDTRFVLEPERVAESPPLPPSLADRAIELPLETRPARAWSVVTWVARGIVGLSAVALVAGSLGAWLQVDVTVPLLGRVVDETLTGPESGQGALFLGVAGVAMLLVVLDVAMARWGLAAGLGEALAGLAAGASSGLTAYRYYTLGQEQHLFGFSLLELYEQYASRVVTVTIRPALYLAVAGLVGVIVGGVLRVIIASLQPADS